MYIYLYTSRTAYGYIIIFYNVISDKTKTNVRQVICYNKF